MSTAWDLVKRVLEVIRDNPDMARLDSLLLADYKRHILHQMPPTKAELQAARRWGIIQGDENE